MRLAFTKMHGLGNDFIVFEARSATDLPSPDDLRRLSDRRTGIGFDQALVLEPPRRAGTDVYYRIFNADGSEVEQCGNGARCIARLIDPSRAQDFGPGEPPRGRSEVEVAEEKTRKQRFGRVRAIGDESASFGKRRKDRDQRRSDSHDG